MSQAKPTAEKAAAPSEDVNAAQTATVTGHEQEKAPGRGADVESGAGGAHGRAASLKSASTGPVYQDDGVTKIEALCEWARV